MVTPSDAIRDELRLPPLGLGLSHPRFDRRAVSRRWMTALLALAITAMLLILGALRTLGNQAHFAAAPAFFRRAPAMVAQRTDRLEMARQTHRTRTIRVEQLDDKGLGTKPFSHLVARLGDDVPLAASSSPYSTEALPSSGEVLPSEILRGSPPVPGLPRAASAYAAPDDVASAAAVMQDDALNSSIAVERPQRKPASPRVVVAKPADTLPQILQALGVASGDVEAISALLAPKGWFRAKAFSGGEKIVVVPDENADDTSPRLRPIKVSIERDDRPTASVARTDDGGFLPVAAPVGAARAPALDSTEGAGRLRSASNESLRESLYAMANANGVDHGVIDSMVRLCAHDVDLDTALGDNDRAELLYGPNDRGEQELAFAALTVAGHVHRYYRFTAPDDGSTDYYDANGHSVTQSLLRKPVEAGRLGDGFGWRMHPVLGVRRMHEGVDYAAPYGSPIVAAGAGTVELINQEIGYGKYIRVRHDQGYETTYAHISAIAPGIHVGSRVRQGETIALVGSTGYSTGPHLYYEVRINGRNVDPLRVKLRSGRVLDGSTLAAFENTRDRADLLLRTSPEDNEGG